MSNSAYATEAALCTAFTEAARRSGFVVYPEVLGWDLVLVGVGGVQIGVQAKMLASWRVLWQATGPGVIYPDHRAVLVPRMPYEFRDLAHRLGLITYEDVDIQLVTHQHGRKIELPRHAGAGGAHRLPLPSVVPESVVAGAPSPRQLTRWREAVLLISAALDAHGRVSGRQVTQAGLRVSNLTSRGWLKRTGWTRGRLSGGLYERGGNAIPDEGWKAEKHAIWLARGHELAPIEDASEAMETPATQTQMEV
jgi:hypothetical protein